MQFSGAAYIEDESQTAAITVTRAGDSSGTSVVNFIASSGTASGGTGCTTGVDFLLVSQTLTFNPSETSKVVNVPLCGDLLTEPLETVTLTLTGANLGTPAAAVLNINDTANQYRNTTEIDLSLGAAAVPYPSTITISGGTAAIGSMRVTLYDVTAQLPDNIDVLLVGPTGVKFILQGDAGGPTPLLTPATLTFSDLAGTVLPNSTALVTGKYEPTNWETPVSNFAAPAPVGPYIEPGNSVGGTQLQSLTGNFGLTDSNGTWSLYVRDDDGQFNVLTGMIAGGWGLEFLPATAAAVTVSGRVMTASGAGVRNARVTVTGNSLVEPLMVTTGSFGLYSFAGLRAGETYVVTVGSQRYTFSVPSHVVHLVDNLAELDFVADQP